MKHEQRDNTESRKRREQSWRQDFGSPESFDDGRGDASFNPPSMQDRQRRYYNDEYTGQKHFDDNYEPRNARRDERSFSSHRQQHRNVDGDRQHSHQYGPQPNYETSGGYQSYRGGYGHSSNQGGYPISQGTGFKSGNFNYGDGTYDNDRYQSQQAEFRGRGPKGYQRSDERLTDDVCERLSNGRINAEDIEVSVSQGIVTLSGTAINRQEKRMAEDLIENVFGVKDVINHIKVGETNSVSQGSLLNQGKQAEQGLEKQPNTTKNVTGPTARTEANGHASKYNEL